MAEVSTALTVATEKTVQPLQQMTREQIELLKRTVAKDCTDDEFSLFVQQCKATGLNPFARQIFAIKRKDTLCMQTSIDGLRIVAERTGKYVGQTSTLWCGQDGKWKDIWLDGKPPAAAKVGILRQDFKEPVYGIALFSEFVQNSNKIFWEKMPVHMLAKCAEAIALRKAFPMELSGIYSTEELGTQDPQEPIRQSYSQEPTNKQTPKRIFTIDNKIPDEFLPAELRGRAITFLDLGKTSDSFSFLTKANGIQNGSYLLQYWSSTPGHSCNEVAIAVLDTISQAPDEAVTPTPQPPLQ